MRQPFFFFFQLFPGASLCGFEIFRDEEAKAEGEIKHKN